MSLEYGTYKVISNIEISKGVYKMEVAGEFDVKPGQFFMLRAWDREPVLSRPISVNNLDVDSISFVYQVVGKGTEILKNLKEDDDIQLLGPCGNYFDAGKIKGKVAIVAGGIGIAPMQYLAKAINGSKALDDQLILDIYAGFRDDVYIIDDIEEYTSNIYLSTESGRYGYKGYITEIFKPELYDVVLCCGPEVMMNKVVKMCADVNVPIYVSMEKHMACGIGACLVCTCKTVNGNKRTCKDGPVFLGAELVL